MHWIDWLIVAASLGVAGSIAILTQRYVKSVADFLTAGRVAGRYVLCVSSAEAGMGLSGLVAVLECMYQSGYAYGFWGSFSAPIAIVLGLMGFAIYRFRETRAMTMGQFLEMRYSRHFRVFAAILQSISGILNYGIFPAVGARFLCYFCGLPTEMMIFGMVFPTYILVMMVFLSIAVTLATMGGQLTIMTTDCVQGLLSYPMYVGVVLFLLLKFSWFQDLAPALFDRSPGKSLINPFDIGELRDFNLFYVIVGIFGSILNRMGWSGNQGYLCAAKNAHEQKMSAVLGSWRSGFSMMMLVLLAVVSFAYLNSDKFQAGPKGAVACRTELAIKVADDVVARKRLAPVRTDIVTYIETGTVTPKMRTLLDKTAAIKVREEADKNKLKQTQGNALSSGAENNPADKTPAKSDAEERQLAREARMRTAQDAIRAVDPSGSQTYGAISSQMRVPMALRYILPAGIAGIFCALCVMFMLSCDISYQHSWGSILVQDIILPLRGKPFSPHRHIAFLRCMIVFVAVFAFFFSAFFGQMDYILMFYAITGAIWLGGSGPCIIGGLYWKRGTAAGAWAALISGSSLALLSIFAQKFWVGSIYPWLCHRHLVDVVGFWLQRASAPFEPLIKWRMSADKFPINSQEIYAINMLVSVTLFVVISLLTSSRAGFNMDRLLHRGKYHREGKKIESERVTWRNIIPTLVGIDRQYTRGDKILAWSVFLWSFGWGFLVCFVVVAIWNVISPWSNEAWSRWFFLNNFLIAGGIGLISTIWFTIGGTMDLRRLFRDLAKKETNVLDDGRVIGHVSADDVELVEKVDEVVIGEAHVEEDILRQELEAEHDATDLDNLKKHTPQQ